MQRNQPPPPSSKKRITVALDPKVLEAAKLMAQKERRNLSNYVEVLLCEHSQAAPLTSPPAIPAPPAPAAPVGELVTSDR